MENHETNSLVNNLITIWRMFLLQDLFTRASAVLYRASETRSYFKEITILVPSTWEQESAEPALAEVFDKVHATTYLVLN